MSTQIYKDNLRKIIDALIKTANEDGVNDSNMFFKTFCNGQITAFETVKRILDDVRDE